MFFSVFYPFTSGINTCNGVMVQSERALLNLKDVNGRQAYLMGNGNMLYKFDFMV